MKNLHIFSKFRSEGIYTVMESKVLSNLETLKMEECLVEDLIRDENKFE